MNHRKPRVLLIGALPPPYIGPSLATQRLISSRHLTDRFEVQLLDISDRRPASTLGALDWGNLYLGCKHALQLMGRLLFKRPAVVYLGVSQGTWGYLRDLAFIFPSLLSGTRLVIHLRGSEFATFYRSMASPLRWLTRLAFRHCARVLVLGERLRRVFDGLVEPERISVVPNGIVCEEFDRPDLVTPPADSGSPGKRLLFLASLKERKGLFVFLRALPAIIARHPGVSVTIAGTWQSDREHTTAEQLLDQLNLRSRCHFTGEIFGDTKLSAFLNHDVFVFPPVEPEGLPWVLLEAMSARLPVVTTNQGAIAEVVADGTTGHIVIPEPMAVASAVCSLLDDPARARAMGAAGRRRVEELFSEQRCFGALADVFAQVIDGPARKVGTKAVASGAS
jgi:glycosyltransferase involved in cell wall biosynthesis